MRSALILVAAALFSAILNNTPVVVLLIPVLAALARERRIASARFLMAMNYATILGGSMTLIGSSTNLLVADIAAAFPDAGRRWPDLRAESWLRGHVRLVHRRGLGSHHAGSGPVGPGLGPR